MGNLNERNISFIVDKEKGCDDGKLRMRVRWNGNTVAVNLGYRVSLDKWSRDTQRCSRNSLHGRKRIGASEINAEIERYERSAESVFREFDLRGASPSADEYRDSLRFALGRQSSRSVGIAPLVSQFLGDMGSRHSWSEGTRSIYEGLGRRLIAECPELRCEDLSDKVWMDSMVADMVAQGRKNRTIRNRVRFCGMLLRWLIDNGHLAESTSRSVETVSLKTTPRVVVYLTWDELMRVYEHRVGCSGVHATRRFYCINMFLLSCFTSLRVSDLRKLKWSDIDAEGIRVVTKKTSKPLYIELNDYSRGVLERIDKDGIGYRDEYVFGYIRTLTSCSSNRYISLVCKDCGIDAPITQVYNVGSERREKTLPKYAMVSMHCGRRTFICNALERGIAPDVVMSWTGHCDYSSMKPYIEITGKRKADAMSLFNKA